MASVDDFAKRPLHKLYINGNWVDPVKGSTFSTINPATGAVISEVANGTAEDIDIAIKAAKACLHSPGWGYESTGTHRAQILRNLGQIILLRKDELARLDSLDEGKPLRESEADVNDVISSCEHFACLAEERDAKQNEVIENGTEGDFVTKILLEPIGVIGAITPWNYPLLMGIGKVVPALAAGCCIVLKPSELAPLSCLLLAELATEAGLPAGALNVVTGLGGDAGAPLSSHMDIDKISFTGSVITARKIMSCAAMGPRGISLELGGKSPLIVFGDADIGAAVDWIMTGFLWGSGQVCSSTSRALVHESIIEKLIEKLIEKVKKIKIGDSLCQEMLEYSGPTMGPVVSEGQYLKIWEYIDEARDLGCRFLYGGDREMVSVESGNVARQKLPSSAHRISPANTVGSGIVGDGTTGTGSRSRAGFFIPPTILTDVPLSSRCWKEEIFGPVLCIRSFSTEEEAITVANDSTYGLAASVFSADVRTCDRVSRRMRAGIVWQNCSQPAFVQAPWGGVKQSGFGRELGRWGMEEFTSVKQVTSCKNDFSWNLW